MDEPAHLTEIQPLRPELPPDHPQTLVQAGRLERFVLATALLALGFVEPLCQWLRLAVGSELYSYVLLVPFISLYLVWSNKPAGSATRPARGMAAGFLLAGGITLLIYWLDLRFHPGLRRDEYVTVMMAAFLLLFIGLCGLFWGRETLRRAVFPLGFLLFMIPIPTPVVAVIDTFLQAGSALAASGFFWLSGTPFFQDGLSFQLADISLQIAPECSGLHSTLVLLITSLLASHLFLQTPWKRALLVLFVIPLGLLRNGFRVFTLGQLCIHWGPKMIDTPIHHKGGPVFFAVSLIPFFLLLILLRKSEPARATKRPGKNSIYA
jgi:exosortase C (VPDSG-CTERM-specific)